jgi:deoxyadenosine/deoxycytidine kinase
MKLIRNKKTKNITRIKYKPIAEANCIAIGGMIAFGKTTLIDALHNQYPNSKSVYELRENDPLQDLLLKGLYEKKVSPEVFQLYFVTIRFNRYKEEISKAEKNQLILFDRTIFEDRLFAHQNMMDKPIEFSFYDNL